MSQKERFICYDIIVAIAVIGYLVYAYYDIRKCSLSVNGIASKVVKADVLEFSIDITNLLDNNTQDHINKGFLKQQADEDKVIKSLVASGINMSSITYSRSLGDWSESKTIDSTIVVRTKNIKFLDTFNLPIINASVSRLDYDYSASEKIIESLEERATDDAQQKISKLALEKNIIIDYIKDYHIDTFPRSKSLPDGNIKYTVKVYMRTHIR